MPRVRQVSPGADLCSVRLGDAQSRCQDRDGNPRKERLNLPEIEVLTQPRPGLAAACRRCASAWRARASRLCPASRPSRAASIRLSLDTPTAQARQYLWPGPSGTSPLRPPVPQACLHPLHKSATALAKKRGKFGEELVGRIARQLCRGRRCRMSWMQGPRWLYRERLREQFPPEAAAKTVAAESAAARGDLLAEEFEREPQAVFQVHLRLPVQDAACFADVGTPLLGVVLWKGLEDDGYVGTQ